MQTHPTQKSVITAVIAAITSTLATVAVAYAQHSRDGNVSGTRVSSRERQEADTYT